MMINILIPMAGKNQYFSDQDYPYPIPLIEIFSKTIIQLVLNNLSTVSKKIKFIFIVNDDDCNKFYLDKTLNILTNNDCKIIRLTQETKGSACSALMAIDEIANDSPLLISNSDQIFDEDICNLIGGFEFFDGGVVTFDSVHPRWSYVKTNLDGIAIEVSEKQPISRQAIAGLYYFHKGDDFVEAAMRMIRKNENVKGNYYIAPVLNQMILDNKKISTLNIDNNKYHTFYSPQKIKDFEALIKNDLK